LLLPLAAPAGRADGVSFSSPTGDWGSTTYTFTIHGISITATAINGGNLFAGNGAGGRSQWRPRDFRKMGGTQDYIQLDLLGLIAAGFTNVKFQMGSTEGGAYSSAGVSGSGRSANASTFVGSHGTLNLAHELERKEPQLFDPPSVPEPSSYALLLAGMLGLAGVSFAGRLATQKA